MSGKNTLNKKNKLGWSLLFLIIAVATVYAVIAQNKNFSLSNFRDFILNSNPVYLVCAVVCMLLFIFTEGMALRTISKSFGYRCSIGQSLSYSASDIYFSAITPSASGGQPACGYFMNKDGMPGSFAAIALIANLSMYVLAIIVVSALCFIFRLNMMFSFSTLSIVLIILGFVVQFGLLIGLVVLLREKKIIAKFGNFFVKFLRLIKLSKKADKFEIKLENTVAKYHEYSQALFGKRKMFIQLFLYNFVQRAAQIMVTVFTYLAVGGSIKNVFDVWFLQSYVILGSNCIPVPGAMGVYDYLMLDGFGKMISDTNLVTNLELFSRSISFYSCIIICGLITIIKYIKVNRKSKAL